MFFTCKVGSTTRSGVVKLLRVKEVLVETFSICKVNTHNGMLRSLSRLKVHTC